jgi:ubiquitin-protein ligase E3 A
MRVRRDFIIQDTLGQISVSDDSEFKKPLKIIFDGEEGVDAGGLQKEYFQVMTRQLLDPNFGMFTRIEDSNTLWFNSDSLESDMEFELVGTLLGIAIYNSIIIDLHFPMVVYRKLKNKQVTLDDLATLQPATARGLRQLLEYDGDVEQAFGFTFQLSHEVFGEIQTIDLVENGGEKPVTNDNRAEYVALYVDWILNKSIESQFSAFARGFRKVCSGPAFDLFIAEELELLLCGNPTLDFEALQRGTRYEDGYDENSAIIHDFWAVVHGFNEEEKRAFLKFMSGSDRAPIEGLSQLGFVISKNGGDSERLPTAHTCFNHLLLPQYSSRAKLAEKLKLAINNAEGFGLR